MWDVPPEEILDGAAAEGVSLTDYIERHFGLPPIDEVIEHIRSRPPVDLGGMTGADLVREGREEHDAKFDRCSSLTRPQ